MTMRVKLVIMIKIAGASDKTVSRMIICMAAEKFSRFVKSGICEGITDGTAGAIDGAGVVVTPEGAGPPTIGPDCACANPPMDSIKTSASALVHRRHPGPT